MRRCLGGKSFYDFIQVAERVMKWNFHLIKFHHHESGCLAPGLKCSMLPHRSSHFLSLSLLSSFFFRFFQVTTFLRWALFPSWWRILSRTHSNASNTREFEAEYGGLFDAAGGKGRRKWKEERNFGEIWQLWKFFSPGRAAVDIIFFKEFSQWNLLKCSWTREEKR